MKIVVTFLLLAMSLTGFSQTEKEEYKTISAKFEKFYNAGQYDMIFDLFSKEMKAALPQQKNKGFLTGINGQFGKMKKREFVKYEKLSYASYKTQCERGTISLNISLDRNSNINGFFIRPYQKSNQPKLERNTTNFILPFKDEWTVFWGGDTKELNYHVENPAQRRAFDIIITGSNGKSYKTNGRSNEDYYAFGKAIVAPSDAKVVLVVDGIKDNVPGEFNRMHVPGNTVILKTAYDEYLFFAHFKQHSIVVKQGQQVKQGEMLGHCGNSGNSSEPHLHFHMQNVENTNNATGAKSYFEKIYVNGILKEDYSPIKGDKVRNNE